MVLFLVVPLDAPAVLFVTEYTDGGQRAQTEVVVQFLYVLLSLICREGDAGICHAATFGAWETDRSGISIRVPCGRSAIRRAALPGNHPEFSKRLARTG